MKTFFNLIQEVQKPGFCHRCGGCVTFCTAVNYGALELDETGKPRFRDAERCIECGLCYLICPEIHELDEEQKRMVSWSAPMGRVLETAIARSKDPSILAKATDGGVVTTLLLHLFDKGFINGAIVTRPSGTFSREPWLALSREDIIASAGFHFDTSHSVKHFGDRYSTYAASIHELGPMARQGLRRVAFVGTPCQIKTVRRMETLGIVPADSIQYHFGLFCAGNFAFEDADRARLEEIGGFKLEDVSRINVKEELLVWLGNGEKRSIPLDRLEFMKRYACRFCDDYSAEYADLSFGGIGAMDGWTTVITRTPLGRAVFASARNEVLEDYKDKDSLDARTRALKKIMEHSCAKKVDAGANRGKISGTPVSVIG